MIYNKEPILVLWDIVKSLSGEIEIYKEAMTEDEDSLPDSYLLLRADISNTPFSFGDGKTKIRVADCDIILVSKGLGDATTDLHNINRVKVENVLQGAEVPYDSCNLGYDDTLKNTQYTWSVTIHYLI